MFIDEQIEKLGRRLKSIENHPRPEFLKCNKLRYEFELDHYIHVHEAWKAGKPFGLLEGVETLAKPMGFEAQSYIGWGDRVSDPPRYLNLAVSKFGFPEHTCDRTMTALGLFLSGEVPTPRLMCSRRIPCDPERWTTIAAAKYAGVLFFDLDRRNSNGYDNVQAIGEQIENMIEYAKKSVPGIEYHEDLLIELMKIDQQAMRYLYETYELRKRVPCPISPQDSFRLMTAIPSRYPNPQKVLEYFKMYRDELFERAEKGIPGVPDEKLRIAWLATGPYGRTTFDMLIKKGVALPWFHYGMAPGLFGLTRDNHFDDAKYGHKLSPIEELVRGWNVNVWGGHAEDWVSTLVTACRDLKIDAVVDFLQVGCITTKNLKRITAQRLRDELGIPTLDLEGREFFSSEEETNNMNRKLEDFLDMCIANKR